LVRQATAYFRDHGVGDTSLRGIAAELQTSHRMLIYHFGSREGLLTAVVDGLWHDLRTMLDEFVRPSESSLAEQAWLFWNAMIAGRIGPLFFELSAAAMQGAPWVDSFREGSEAWVAHLEALLSSAGHTPGSATELARLTMAVVRGALWELGISGDRVGADSVVRSFIDDHWPRREGSR
jgi:AcrR family transcriptional regulator